MTFSVNVGSPFSFNFFFFLKLDIKDICSFFQRSSQSLDLRFGTVLN
jgi:serine/threonine-protein kinase RIO1